MTAASRATRVVRSNAFIATAAIVLAAAITGLVLAASSGAQSQRKPGGAPRAPSGPPLTSPSTSPGTEAESLASATSSTGDPLVSNGLGSPLCHGGAGRADLSSTGQSNCQTSGFQAASAPTGNYSFDVHIDTGVTNLGNDLSATVQNLLQLGWTVLIAAVHCVIVMLEWCYSIDLLNSSAMGGLARGLRETQATFTEPWLALVLAVASVLALYHGLVRRQVAETVGQAVLMLAMMVGGLWVIMNPAGTVGALGSWANQAGLGTLGAVTSGSPDRPDRTLADSMQSVFSGTITAPWCFMEFGDVGWCSDPARIDPRLRASGSGLATLEQAQIRCPLRTGSINIGSLTSCASPGSAQARVLSHSAELLRGARTNGGLFLALPANQAARNSISATGSLFNVLCGGSEQPCKGPTAAQAEFRTQSGTGWRFMGLLFIWVGVLGAILMLGFIALRLLAATIGSLFYLLLAPAAVLAPALGDGGRAAFRGWATRLLGAVMSKLIYSFVLGVVLLMQRVLTVYLTALGWFAQWLLVSAMWWGAFHHRHQMLSFAHAGRVASPVRGLRLTSSLMSARELGRMTGWARRKLSPSIPPEERDRKWAEAGRERAEVARDEQVKRSLDRDHRDATALTEAAPEIQQRLSFERARLERIRGEHGKASAVGDTRKAAQLEHRAGHLEGKIANEQQRLNEARRTAAAGEHARRATGEAYTSEQRESRERFLDLQAALPSSRQGTETGETRDYAALAGLAGYGREQFERLDRRGQRSARLEIDRELALRKELSETALDLAASSSEPPLRRRDRRSAGKQFDKALQQRMRDAGHSVPPMRGAPSALESWRSDARTDRRSASAQESSVMRDAREVAARRKRQLGREPRP